MQVAETFTFDIPNLNPWILDKTLLKDVSQLDTCVTVVDCSNFYTYFNSREIASEVFTDIDPADGRSVFHLMHE